MDGNNRDKYEKIYLFGEELYLSYNLKKFCELKRFYDNVISSNIDSFKKIKNDDDFEIKYDILNGFIDAAAERTIKQLADYRIYNVTKSDLLNNEFYYELKNLKDVSIDRMNILIKGIINSILVIYIRELEKIDVINLEQLSYIDEERSNSILSNLDIVDSKDYKKVILEAIKLCPYNENIYYEAVICNVFNEELLQILKFLGLDEDFEYSIEKKLIELKEDMGLIWFNLMHEPYVQALVMMRNSDRKIILNPYKEYFYNKILNSTKTLIDDIENNKLIDKLNINIFIKDSELTRIKLHIDSIISIKLLDCFQEIFDSNELKKDIAKLLNCEEEKIEDTLNQFVNVVLNDVDNRIKNTNTYNKLNTVYDGSESSSDKILSIILILMISFLLFEILSNLFS